FRRRVRRLRIGDEQIIVGVDVDAARPAELIPAREILTVLVVDLDPVVVAIADEEPSLRVDRERVQARELARAARSVPRLAPLRDELAGLVEFHYPLVRAFAVAVGDEYVAVLADDDVARRAELVRALAGDFARAGPEQERDPARWIRITALPR